MASRDYFTGRQDANSSRNQSRKSPERNAGVERYLIVQEGEIMSEEVKDTEKQKYLQRLVKEESRKFLIEHQEEIVKRAFARLKEEAAKDGATL